MLSQIYLSMIPYKVDDRQECIEYPTLDGCMNAISILRTTFPFLFEWVIMKLKSVIDTGER